MTDPATLAARPFVSHSARCRLSGAHTCLCGYDARVEKLAEAFREFARASLPSMLGGSLVEPGELCPTFNFRHSQED